MGCFVCVLPLACISVSLARLVRLSAFCSALSITCLLIGFVRHDTSFLFLGLVALGLSNGMLSTPTEEVIFNDSLAEEVTDLLEKNDGLQGYAIRQALTERKWLLYLKSDATRSFGAAMGCVVTIVIIFLLNIGNMWTDLNVDLNSVPLTGILFFLP